MRTTLVVSAESYPWDLTKEQTFLQPELEVLARSFDQVILAPQQIGGSRFAVPAAVEVDESYARQSARLSTGQLLLRAGATTLVSEDLLRRRRAVLNPAAMKRLLVFAGRAHHAAHWAQQIAARLPSERIIFYTYWWGATTTGFGLARRDDQRLRVVSRAHGFDLYEDRHQPPYLPCRHRSARVLDALFPDSDRGCEHLRASFGEKLQRNETARLGVTDPGVICAPSTDGVLRVVSCSMQLPVKRLHLLIDGLARVASKTPSKRVEWTHFGKGPLQAELEAQVARTFPQNATARFAGYSSQLELFEWYGANPVDVFVNVSSSEGTPVSIMEALACGIPVLATAVGGNPEVATPTNALLVGADPTPDELGAALSRFASGELVALREGSRALWARRYDASTNFEAFVAALKSC